MVGIRWFPFEMAYVQVRTVTFREGTLDWNIALDWNDWLCLEYFPYTFRCEIKRWTLEAQNGMGTNVYSLAANWTFFRRKTVLEKMDLHSSTRTLGTYTQIYIYIYATSQVLRVSDLKSLANWNCSSSLINLSIQKTSPFWDHCHPNIQTSKHFGVPELNY